MINGNFTSAVTVAGDTREVRKTIIAERILGMPRG